MPDLFRMLAADGPCAELGEGRRLYAPLIGSWDVEASWHMPDGSTREAKGEWHFAWVLGGRGIQDVLPRSRRRAFSGKARARLTRA
jgi:hypothetical protein